MKNGDVVLNIAGVDKEAVVDGEGFRYTVFTQGCPHHCEGCHNPTTWDFNKGHIVSTEEVLEEIDDNPLLSGITFSGGEPFMQTAGIIELADAVHRRNMSVWCYTGYTFEFLLTQPRYLNALRYIDVLVDGPYEKDKRDLTLEFRGSSNQRVIDVVKSLREGKVALWVDK